MTERDEHGEGGNRPVVVVEGSLSDDDLSDGDIMELPNGHRYEMGVRHACGVDGCPANTVERGER